MGAKYIDYLIADETLIPEASRQPLFGKDYPSAQQLSSQ